MAHGAPDQPEYRNTGNIMKIDTQEMQALAAAPIARMDMYTTIHKGLRALMADTLHRLGRLDCDDDEEVEAVTAQFTGLMDACLSHLEHEEAFVHPALQARCPGVADAAGEDHLGHRAHIESLAAAAGSLRRLPARQRADAALALYRELAHFVAENLEHMHREETLHNQALWSAYTDEELGALHDRLLASIPPGEMMQTIRWMVPALSPAERSALIGGMRAAAPEPAFKAVMQELRTHLDPLGWTKLCRSLGMQPAGPTH
jgi:iron-sulfur cluster repair protein YtfE (RIC family)